MAFAPLAVIPRKLDRRKRRQDQPPTRPGMTIDAEGVSGQAAAHAEENLAPQGGQRLHGAIGHDLGSRSVVGVDPGHFDERARPARPCDARLAHFDEVGQAARVPQAPAEGDERIALTAVLHDSGCEAWQAGRVSGVRAMGVPGST